MKRKILLSAWACFGWAFASWFIVTDAWVHRKSGAEVAALVGEQQMILEGVPAGEANRLARRAPWDGVVVKRAADAAYAAGRFREAERNYARAMRLAPGHYLTSWALGRMAFEHAPESLEWEESYRAARRLHPIHEALRRDFVERLCRRALAEARMGAPEAAEEWLRKAEENGGTVYWLPLARGAVGLARDDDSAWSAFREAVHDAKRSTPDVAEHAARYFRVRAEECVARRQWERARRMFDLSGSCERDIGRFLREVHALYRREEAMVWGGKPVVVLEDFSARSVLETWRVAGRFSAATFERGMDGNGRPWEEARVAVESLPRDGGLSYWIRPDLRLHPGDDVYVEADVWTSECGAAPVLGIAMYLSLTYADATVPKSSTLYGRNALPSRDLGGGWRRVTFGGVGGGLMSPRPIRHMDIPWFGPSVTGPCARVRVARVAIGLM